MIFVKARVLSLTVLVLTASSIASSPAPSRSSEVSTHAAEGNVPLSTILQKYGEAYSIYFTIEHNDVDFTKEAKNPSGVAHDSDLWRVFITPPNGVKDEADFLDRLRRWLPFADITKDEAFPGVVQIREKSLAQLADYILDKKIDIQSNGTVKDLLGEVSRKSDGAIQLSGATVAPGAYYDLRTPTSVDLRDATFRSVLTGGIPRRTNRILWEADAAVIDGATAERLILAPSAPLPAASSQRSSATSSQKPTE